MVRMTRVSGRMATILRKYLSAGRKKSKYGKSRYTSKYRKGRYSKKSKYGKSRYSKKSRYGKKGSYKKYDKNFKVSSEVRKLKWLSQGWLDYFGTLDPEKNKQLVNVLAHSKLNTCISAAAVLVGGYPYCKYTALNDDDKLRALSFAQHIRIQIDEVKIDMKKPGAMRYKHLRDKMELKKQRDDLRQHIQDYLDLNVQPSLDLAKTLSSPYNLAAALRDVAAEAASHSAGPSAPHMDAAMAGVAMASELSKRTRFS